MAMYQCSGQSPLELSEWRDVLNLSTVTLETRKWKPGHWIVIFAATQAGRH